MVPRDAEAMSSTTAANVSVRPFTFEAPAEDLDDLRRRINAIRWPERETYNQLDRGGHFAAWEQPALFSQEMRAAFRPLRES